MVAWRHIHLPIGGVLQRQHVSDLFIFLNQIKFRKNGWIVLESVFPDLEQKTTKSNGRSSKKLSQVSMYTQLSIYNLFMPDYKRVRKQCITNNAHHCKVNVVTLVPILFLLRLAKGVFTPVPHDRLYFSPLIFSYFFIFMLFILLIYRSNLFDVCVSQTG